MRERAGLRCEYCRIHEGDTAVSHQVDHVIAEKHGGLTDPNNLALACFLCNNNKGSDLASLSVAGEITRFFNPRTDSWGEHFQIAGDRIQSLTAIGEATERIFAFNTPERREERRGLQALKRYPTQN